MLTKCTLLFSRSQIADHLAYVGGFPRFLETTQARQFSSTQCTVVSFPAARNTQFPCTLCKVCDERMFRTLHGGAEAYSCKTVILLDMPL